MRLPSTKDIQLAVVHASRLEITGKVVKRVIPPLRVCFPEGSRTSQASAELVQRATRKPLASPMHVATPRKVSLALSLTNALQHVGRRHRAKLGHMEIVFDLGKRIRQIRVTAVI